MGPLCCLLLLVASLAYAGPREFTLDGSSNSYIQFGPVDGGALDLEFQTDAPNGLLIYAEAGAGNFLELKLVDGTVRGRTRQWNVGLGRNLHDTRWHRLDLWPQTDSLVIRVDEDSRPLPYPPRNFSTVFVGGVPGPRTALFSVAYEPRFRGSLRPLSFGTPLASQGLRLTSLDACEAHNPCHAGGVCLNTDSGALCDCRNTGFTGPFCDQETVPQVGSFEGQDSIRLEFAGAIQSSSEIWTLWFKTRHANGEVMRALGQGEDYLSLSLKQGGLVLTTRMGGAGVLDKVIDPPHVRFDDHQWHHVEVRRKVREITKSTGYCHVTLVVDHIYLERGAIGGSFRMLEVVGLEFGLAGFRGCLKQAELEADSLHLDLLEIGPINSTEASARCEARDPHDPATFTTPAAFLATAWRFSSLSFHFRTTEPDGLIVASPSLKVGLLLSRGRFALLLPGPTPRQELESPPLNDGNWHVVSLRRTARSGRLSVDDAALDFSLTMGDMEDSGALYIGGSGEEGIGNVPWGAEPGFVGCIQDLTVDGSLLDLTSLAKEQDAAAIRPACHPPSQPLCDSQPCLHGGRCIEGWHRYRCDCSSTSHSGPVCAHEAVTLTFDGQQFFRASIPQGSATESEQAVVRFRTAKRDGLLFIANSAKSATHVTAIVQSGRLHVTYKLGEGEEMFYVGEGLADLQWHAVSIQRRGHKLDLKVDDLTSTHELKSASHVLHVDTIFVGGVDPPSPNSFVGQMQHFTFNNFNYFEQALEGKASGFEITAQFSKVAKTPHLPVAVKSKYTFVALPQMKAYFSLRLSLQFKTAEPNGLLAYHGGRGDDFMAVELAGGNVVYSVRLGDGVIRQARSSRPLNDNQWHEVAVTRPSRYLHALRVDTEIHSFMGPELPLDLAGGLLYVAGVQRPMYDSLPVKSRHGFLGCLATLELDGMALDLIQDAAISSTLVSKGCPEPVTKCSSSACANHGLCVQLWNTYTCDCDLTSFSGPSCSDESIAYEFGPGTGVIVFHFPPDKQPDTKTDLLALGFLTMARNALLVRVDSGESNDYLELEIVDGNLFVVYNMGTEDHPIGEPSVQVNDGHYHVVRFTRNGANSTLQVDDHNIRSKRPEGRQLSVFNSQSKIQVGGKKNPTTGTILKPFQGVISGLVWNGYRVLDLTAESDPRVGVEGDVELLVALPYSAAYPSSALMQSQPSEFDLTSDDLVFSNPGSGCWDDEDNCGVEEFGSGDDLITPMFITPTPKPTPPPPPPVTTTTTTTTTTTASPALVDMVCDDEEECAEGSGVGPREEEPPPPPLIIRPTKRPIAIVRTSPREPPPVVITYRPPVERPTTTAVSTTRPPPVEYPVPIPEFPSQGNEQPRPLPANKSSAVYTALMIGLTAGVLIAVVLIVLMLYRLRPLLGLKAAPPPPPAAPPANVAPDMNGSLKTPPKLPKKKDVKDLKEWYV